MKFIDMNDDRIYTLADLKKDWEVCLREDPINYAADFKTELFEILMATINGRNDLHIIGPTPAEVSRFIISLRAQL